MARQPQRHYGDIAGVSSGKPVDSAGTAPASAAEVSAFHRKSDVDSSSLSQHHTLGSSALQASPGDHTHDGVTSAMVSFLSADGKTPLLSAGLYSGGPPPAPPKLTLSNDFLVNNGMTGNAFPDATGDLTDFAHKLLALDSDGDIRFLVDQIRESYVAGMGSVDGSNYLRWDATKFEFDAAYFSHVQVGTAADPNGATRLLGMTNTGEVVTEGGTLSSGYVQMASGSFTQAVTANTAYTLGITYPSGRFRSTPQVKFWYDGSTNQASSIGRNSLDATSGQTTTGFTALFYPNFSGIYQGRWIAVGN